MATKIRFFGFAAFEIVTAGGEHVIIDPYLDKSAVSPVKSADLEKVDLILVTHGAWDHLGDTYEIARRHGAPVVCGPEVKEALVMQGLPAEQVLAVAWGLEIDFRGLRVRPVESRHTSRVSLPDGRALVGFPMGFILYTADGARIYHMGDTALFSDMRLIGELYKPNIGLVHVTLPDAAHAGDAQIVTGEMTPYESALACQWLGLEYAVACHYTDPECDDVRQFVRLAKDMDVAGRPPFKPIVLKPGEAWTYEG